MKSLYKHVPMVGDRHCIFIKELLKVEKRRKIYRSAKFTNWHFKCNILGKVRVLGNKCIHLCPEKCILGQIQIACQEVC